MLPSNLYAPVPGDQGATGIFSDQAHSTSPQIWAIKNRGLAWGLAAATAATLGAAVATVVAKKK